jgi:hypothetical protein
VSLNALLLLGWMEKQEAVEYLTQGCIFEDPLTEARAEAKWNEYRERVLALPERVLTAPRRFPIPAGSKGHVTDFLRRLRRPGSDVLDVINVNPMELRRNRSRLSRLSKAIRHGQPVQHPSHRRRASEPHQRTLQRQRRSAERGLHRYGLLGGPGAKHQKTIGAAGSDFDRDAGVFEVRMADVVGWVGDDRPGTLNSNRRCPRRASSATSLTNASL